ncbi:MAG: bifunctional aminoglycoside phosphotransferase/ATP-binding protein [Burkholderiaceae bacterium]
METTDPIERHMRLVAGLRALLAGDAVETIETHISTVLLAGSHAYKLKKPVDLGFLDFTTLEARRRYCEQELRLNRRTAPQLYLDVLPVTGTVDAPRLGGAGEPIDWVVRMRRFAASDLLDSRARAGTLDADCIDRLAAAIAAFHMDAPRVDAASPLGSAGMVARWMFDNLEVLRAHAAASADRARIDALGEWTRRELARRAALLQARHRDGFVRECHGDLHLGNIVLVDGFPVPFDCIEFNDELRCIDVVNDIAFTVMDLLDRRQGRLAWRLANAYLEATGDYGGVPLVRLYSVYRALVRAKVALIRAQQPAVDPALRVHEHGDFADHLALAERLAQPRPPLVVAMHGLSGSGKTFVAQHLLERLGAVRVRSDVERKRLFSLPPTARVDADLRAELYGAEATRATYDRLAAAARAIVDGGFAAIVDAAFLRRAERDAFGALARSLGARFAVLACEAPADVLRARVAARASADRDASDATVDVLERQMTWCEPPDEAECALRIDTGASPDAVARRCDALAHALGADDGA